MAKKINWIEESIKTGWHKSMPSLESAINKTISEMPLCVQADRNKVHAMLIRDTLVHYAEHGCPTVSDMAEQILTVTALADKILLRRQNCENCLYLINGYCTVDHDSEYFVTDTATAKHCDFFKFTRGEQSI